MKKVLLVLLALVLMVLMVACGGSSKSSSRESRAPSSAAPSIKDNPDDSEVTIVIPAILFEMLETEGGGLEYLYGFAEALLNEDGTLSVVVNADNTITLVVTAKHQQEKIDEMQEDIDRWCDFYLNFPYVSEITYNSGFTEFTVKVDEANYRGSDMEGIPLYSLAFDATIHRAFAGESGSVVTFLYVNAETGDVLDTVLCPER